MLKDMPTSYKCALLIFAIICFAWLTFVNISTTNSFNEYKARMDAQPETITLLNSDGTTYTVPKADYDAANARWKAEHPEQYNIPTEGD